MSVRERVTCIEDIASLKDNTIVFSEADGFEIMDEVEIVFSGTNNILFCDGRVKLRESMIRFEGDNSIVFLSSSSHIYRANFTLYNNNVLFIDEDCYFSDVLNAICSEQKHIIIGKECLFSFEVWVRTADPHLVYSKATNRRLNPSKSVFLGDHIWVGQNVGILKGSRVHSGCIIGGHALLPGKTIPSHCLFAGNPGQVIKEDIFWEGKSVHGWTDWHTRRFQVYNEKDAELGYTKGNCIYEYDEEQHLPFDEIEKNLVNTVSVEEKLEYLKALKDNREVNRFTDKPKPAPVEPPMTFKRKISLWLKKRILRIIK